MSHITSNFVEFHKTVLQFLDGPDNLPTQEDLNRLQVQLISFYDRSEISQRELNNGNQLLSRLQAKINDGRPRERFRFSRTARVTEGVQGQEDQVISRDTDTNDIDTEAYPQQPTVKNKTLQNSVPLETKASSIHDRISERIFPEPCTTSQDIVLENLVDCFVALKSSYSALRLRNVSRSIILAPNIESSALLYNCKQCVIVIGSAHQLRIHTSSNTVFLVSAKSDPIIEECKEIIFGFLPFSVRASIHVGPQTTGILEKGVKSTVSPPRFKVVDFDWHHPEKPSPHWRWIQDVVQDEVVESFFAYPPSHCSDAQPLLSEDTIIETGLRQLFRFPRTCLTPA